MALRQTGNPNPNAAPRGMTPRVALAVVALGMLGLSACVSAGVGGAVVTSTGTVENGQVQTSTTVRSGGVGISAPATPPPVRPY